jgi:hypothetical protein
MPLPSTAVTQNDGPGSEELGDEGGNLFAGWWVGADDNWHPPEEPFVARHATGSRRLRQIVVIIVALMIVAVTSVSVWGGSFTTPSTSGPSTSDLSVQVRHALTSGTGGKALVGGVTDVKCQSPGSWTSGEHFTCDVFGSSGNLLGRYEGTVQTAGPTGGWRWTGLWVPKHQSSIE